MRHDRDVQRLLEERLRHRAQHHAGRRLPRAGPLQDRPGVVEAVLRHTRQVGVPRTGPGERRVAGPARDQLGVDRVGRHDRLPLRPLGVADPHGHRPALGDTVPDAADHLQLVGLELHPRPAAVAEAATGQLGGQLLGGDLDPGDHALQHGDQGRTVGLPGGDPAQHACDSLTPHHRSPPPPRAASHAVTSHVAASIDGPCGSAAPRASRPVANPATAASPVSSAASTAASTSAGQPTAASTAPSGAASLTSPAPIARRSSRCSPAWHGRGDQRSGGAGEHPARPDRQQEQKRHGQRRQRQGIGEPPVDHVDRARRDGQPPEPQQHRNPLRRQQPGHPARGDRRPHHRDPGLAPEPRHPRASPQPPQEHPRTPAQYPSRHSSRCDSRCIPAATPAAARAARSVMRVIVAGIGVLGGASGKLWMEEWRGGQVGYGSGRRAQGCRCAVLGAPRTTRPYYCATPRRALRAELFRTLLRESAAGPIPHAPEERP